MADDVLNAAELETLLARRKPAATAPQDRPRGKRAESTQPLAAGPSPALVSSDSRRPVPPLSETLKRALAEIGDRCARQFALQLSTLVRRTARVELVSVSRVTYPEFAARLAAPTCCNLLSAAPLAGEWVLEISPAILYPAIDCMLGGTCEPARTAPRPFTDIELRLAARVTNLFLDELRAAWRPVAELGLAVTRVTTRPPACETTTAAEAVIWVRFQAEISAARGAVNLAIPSHSLAELSERWAPEPAAASLATATPDQSRETARGAHEQATVELIACLAQSTIAAEEVRQLAVGDVITTQQKVDAPIAVLRDGVICFLARVGAMDGRKALEIEKTLAQSPPPAPIDAIPQRAIIPSRLK